MKIISFSVNNFRWISGWMDKNTINFWNSNTIFIFWQNNVGKSTFLKAYDFFYSNKSPWEDDLFKKDASNLMEFELELEFDEFDFQKEAIKQKSSGLKTWLRDEKFLRIRREIASTKVGEKFKFETKNFTFDWTGDWKWEEKNYGWIWLDGVFQSSLPKPIFIKAMPTEEETENIINEILAWKAEKALEDKERKELKDAQDKIKELQEKIYNPKAIKDYKEEVNKHFQKLFPETKIDLEEKDKVVWSENKFWKKFNIQFQKLDASGIQDSSIPTGYSKVWHWAIRSAFFHSF